MTIGKWAHAQTWLVSGIGLNINSPKPWRVLIPSFLSFSAIFSIFHVLIPKIAMFCRLLALFFLVFLCNIFHFPCFAFKNCHVYENYHQNSKDLKPSQKYFWYHLELSLRNNIHYSSAYYIWSTTLPFSWSQLIMEK